MDTAQVGNTGAFQHKIGIKIPPDTAGVAPNLSLIYNSQSRDNGLVGMGWSLRGLPAIERCPASYEQDGFRGAVRYDDKDRYCIDGKRLMMINGAVYGAEQAEYRTEVDSFLKIISYGSAGVLLSCAR